MKDLLIILIITLSLIFLILIYSDKEYFKQNSLSELFTIGISKSFDKNNSLDKNNSVGKTEPNLNNHIRNNATNMPINGTLIKKKEDTKIKADAIPINEMKYKIQDNINSGFAQKVELVNTVNDLTSKIASSAGSGITHQIKLITDLPKTLDNLLTDNNSINNNSRNNNFLDNSSLDNSSTDSDTSGEQCKTSDARCTIDKCGKDNLHPILDPQFNMRESAKQCLLLEDHLNNTKKRCFDCIRKHFLIVDGFLEEAISLEHDISKREMYRKLYLDWIKIEKQYAKDPTNSTVLDNVSKQIRSFRKPLVEKYFDTISKYDD